MRVGPIAMPDFISGEGDEQGIWMYHAAGSAVFVRTTHP